VAEVFSNEFWPKRIRLREDDSFFPEWSFTRGAGPDASGNDLPYLLIRILGKKYPVE